MSLSVPKPQQRPTVQQNCTSIVADQRMDIPASLGPATTQNCSPESATVLSILMPVYNEQHYVEQIVDNVMCAPLPAHVSRELIIVDDCSTDGTLTILKRLAATYPDRVRVLFHETNRGKGSAVRTAIAAAKGEICVIQDADLEYDPRDYKKLIQPILDGDADVVYGSRFLPSDRRRVLYFWHRLGNKLLTCLSNMFTDLDLTDMETCYKVCKTHILKSIPIRSDGFDLEPELTAKLAKRGCRIYEVPISYRGRSYQEGKKVTWRDGLRAFWTILRYRIVDDVYEETYGSAPLHNLARTHRLHDWMAATAAPWIGERVLELGAGLGNITLCLIPRNTYIASDNNPHCLEYLRTRFGGYGWMHVLEINGETPTGFADLPSNVDTVVCINTLECASSDNAVLENIHAVLAPGGNAIVFAPQGRWLWGPLDRAHGYRRRYTEQDLTQKCRAAGFIVEHVRSFNRTGTLPWMLNSLLLGRSQIGKFQLKFFDSFIWIWRRLDSVIPLPGLSIFAVLRKPV